MLILVATPIGNLEDITLRALNVLREADIIASEDMRKTGRLLKHFDITARQIAYHEHNEQKITPRLLTHLTEGRTIALVSNAGTPGIADPGFRLIQAALHADIQVTMAPGPSALIMALVVSGLPLHRFTFVGFPPRKSGARRRLLEADLSTPHTLIYYESPHRIQKLISDALDIFGDRPAALANDLTKMYERVDRGPLSALLEGLIKTPPKGEYILVIAGNPT